MSEDETYERDMEICKAGAPSRPRHDDISIVETFIFDELAVRIQSAELEPNNDEENDIAEAKAARLAFHRIKSHLQGAL